MADKTLEYARVVRVDCLLVLHLYMPERYNKPQFSKERQHPFFPSTMFNSQPTFPRRPRMHRRRDATTVMAGYFDRDPIRERDIVKSRLNNIIGRHFVVEKDGVEDQQKEMEKRTQDRDRKGRMREEARVANKRRQRLAGESVQPGPSASSGNQAGRPIIHIPAMWQSFSFAPIPPPSLHFDIPAPPSSTPGPSASSSNRPNTPYDEEVVAMGPTPRKKRPAVKKGWKGWVEGSPEPSDKLINLDAVHTLQEERRTRSGKSFDTISVGNDWV